jgi:hypothetical protein
MANSIYAENQLSITSPTLALKTYRDTSPERGTVLTRSFCGDCGSSLFVRSDEGVVAVTSGSLDHQQSGSDWEPEREYFCKRKCAWLGDLGMEEKNKFLGMS